MFLRLIPYLTWGIDRFPWQTRKASQLGQEHEQLTVRENYSDPSAADDQP